ncbi:embryonic protein UVS.2-like isoform X2 [Mercenaria mercenaria]|nr:embryonic protein UVS.2-like isoform X2 [Mercenaria mercenaria]
MSTQCDLSEHYLPFAGNLLESQAGASVYYPKVLQCNLVYSTHLASGSINTITSPNYPGYYPHNMDQYWLIVKPTRVSTLEIEFQPIDVELSDGCAYDSVTFYSGFCPSEELVINRVCGAANSYTFPASNTLHILVRFLTDSDNINDVNHVGFSIKFRIL